MALHSRRQLLTGIGVFATTLVAGCTADREVQTPEPTPTPTDSPTPPAATPYTPTTPATGTPTDDEDVVKTEPTDLDASPLQPAWEQILPGQYELSTPGLGEQHVFIGSRREIFAVNRDTGVIDWATDLGAMTRAITPEVTDGAVYAAARNLMGNQIQEDNIDGVWVDEHDYDEPTGGSTLSALEPTSGAVLWENSLPISGSPVLDNDQLFIGLATLDGRTGVASVHPADGSVNWKVEVDTPEVFSNPSFSDDCILFTTGPDEAGDSWVVSVSQAGELRWTRRLEGEVWNELTVADGVAYAGTDEGVLYAIESDNTVNWSRVVSDAPRNAIHTTPAVHNGVVYVSATNRLFALDVEDGEELWRGGYTDDARSGISISGGMVHVGGLEISSFDLDGNEAKWRIDLPGSAGSFGAPLYDEHDEAIYTGACVKIDNFDWYEHTLYRLE